MRRKLEVLVPRCIIVLPGPPTEVHMLPRRPVELLPCLANPVSHQVGQAHILFLQGRPCEEVPEELVGMSATNKVTLAKEGIGPSLPCCPIQ